MLRLYILRHAKSAWPMPSTGDHDRPLNQRGKGDLPNIAAMLVKRDYIPELAFCSSAQRTLETWQGVERSLPDCKMEVRHDLYESNARKYFSVITSVASISPVMLIGHNPVCDELTRLLITGDGEAAGRFLPSHFPTGGLAVLDFDVGRWSDIQPTTAYLVDFVRPKELRQS